MKKIIGSACLILLSGCFSNLNGRDGASGAPGECDEVFRKDGTNGNIIHHDGKKGGDGQSVLNDRCARGQGGHGGHGFLGGNGGDGVNGGSGGSGGNGGDNPFGRGGDGGRGGDAE